MRSAAILLVLGLLAGCTRGSGEEQVEVADLGRISERTSLSSREFEAIQKADKTALGVAGLVEDDYRYRAAVAADGVSLYEEVVIDDARYFRLSDPSQFAGVAATDPGLTAVLTGGWLVDPHGAPPEFLTGPAAGPLPPLDPRFVLSRVRFLDTLPAVIRRGREPKKYNPDAADFLPKDDKFPRRKADGIRFDAIPLAFDPGISAVSVEALEPYFQYASVWVKMRRITRVERLFELPGPEDPQFKELFEQFRRGVSGLPSPVLASGKQFRVTDTYLFRVPQDGARVEAPANAVTVNLAEVLAAFRIVAAGRIPGVAEQAPSPPDIPGLPGG